MEQNRAKKVLVGISGGVDSAVTVYLLQKQGYEVIGLYLKMHEDIPHEENILKIEKLSKLLNFKYFVEDISDNFKQKVFDYFIESYKNGDTPNPCAMCNREIKFGEFIPFLEKYDCEYLATGHYARKEEITKEGKKIYRLLAGVDDNKDQSYFLCQLSQKQLSKALFPIGDMLKPNLRKLAKTVSLATADKKDSQGICFVGKVDLPVFLQQQLKAKKGKIIEVPESYYQNQAEKETLEELSNPYRYLAIDGNVVGEHNGAHYFTIGQRKGLNVGGKKEPLFVIATDIEYNIIYVGQSDRHQGLYRKALFIKEEEIHWVRPDLQTRDGEEHRYDLRIRYRQALQKGKLIQTKKGIYLLFDTPQRGIAAGQFAAWYDGEELIGSGVIAY